MVYSVTNEEAQLLEYAYNGEAESMAREQAMADMMLGGTEFDYQELYDYTNLITDVVPEALTEK